MSLELIRRIVRYVAAGAVPVAIAIAVFGMMRSKAFPAHEILDGAILFTIILGLWVWVEVKVLTTRTLTEVVVQCKDEVIAAQPPAKAIVARTLEALEAEQEREAAADLPRIAEGRRQ